MRPGAWVCTVATWRGSCVKAARCPSGPCVWHVTGAQERAGEWMVERVLRRREERGQRPGGRLGGWAGLTFCLSRIDPARLPPGPSQLPPDSQEAAEAQRPGWAPRRPGPDSQPRPPRQEPRPSPAARPPALAATEKPAGWCHRSGAGQLNPLCPLRETLGVSWRQAGRWEPGSVRGREGAQGLAVCARPPSCPPVHSAVCTDTELGSDPVLPGQQPLLLAAHHLVSPDALKAVSPDLHFICTRASKCARPSGTGLAKNSLETHVPGGRLPSSVQILIQSSPAVTLACPAVSTPSTGQYFPNLLFPV